MFIKTSQEVFCVVETGEDLISLLVVVGLVFNSADSLCNAGRSAVGFTFPLT